MNTNRDEILMSDFMNWSGGFPPDSTDQIWSYALMSAPGDFSEEETVACLTRWLLEAEELLRA